MNRRTRFLLIGASPLACTLVLLACTSDPPHESFDASDGGAPDAVANLPEASPDPADAGIVDARTPFDGSDEALTCTATPCVTDLVAGANHFCALLADHTVQCWGSAYVQFGHYDGGGDWDPAQSRPLSMGLSNVTQLSAEGNTTCARFGDGTVKCWGSNFGGAIEPLAYDFEPHDPTPIPITDVARVDIASFNVVFATKTSGELWSWGAQGDALARPDVTTQYVGPGRANTDGAKIVRAGGTAQVGLAVTDEAQLLLWGGNNPMVPYPGPVPVPAFGLENVLHAAASVSHVCAVADGHLYCWGRNGNAACSGLVDAVMSPLEIKTHGLARPQQVAVNDQGTCVRMTNGSIQCCGSDDHGQLGTGEEDAGAESSFVLIEAKAFVGHAIRVALGQQTTCVLVQGGSVQCWGSNEYGQLGQGTRDKDRHPAPVTVAFQ